MNIDNRGPDIWPFLLHGARFFKNDIEHFCKKHLNLYKSLKLLIVIRTAISSMRPCELDIKMIALICIFLINLVNPDIIALV